MALPASAAPATGGAFNQTARLAALRAAPRLPGQDHLFFYWDAHFRTEAVKVLPGEYYVHDEDILITTTLGSCIAVCLWDRDRKIGGLNHFLLPSGDGAASSAGRYGSYAMELLINAMLKRGASRLTLEAKVFGGASVVGGMVSIDVGGDNNRFITSYLAAERIPIVSQDVLGHCARKVCFLPKSGRAMLKRLAPTHPDALNVDAAKAARAAVPVASAGGSVDLF